MPLNSKHPLALITGASAGLGAQFARACAARGHDLVLVARRLERLEALGAELTAAHGVQVQSIRCDLGQVDAHLGVFAALGERAGAVDVLVNNAGYGMAEEFDEAPWSAHQAFLMTLLVNACALAHGVIPGMKARGRGAIINVASLAGFAPGVASHSLYPATKSFMIKFSQALHAELAGDGIRVTASCPGFTHTEFHQANGTQAHMDRTPRFIWQSAQTVVASALSANDRGKAVDIPGLHNRLAAAALRHLPQGLLAALAGRGVRRFGRRP